MRTILVDELKDLELFRDVRGRGLRFSFEYETKNNVEFAEKLSTVMLEKHNIMISAKWHRVCFTPPLILTKQEAESSLEKLIKEIKSI